MTRTRPGETSATWSAAVAAHPLDTATRLVAGQLADRATRGGRVKVAAADLAACCLPVTVVADALADLASRGLRAQDRGAFVFVTPGSVR